MVGEPAPVSPQKPAPVSVQKPPAELTPYMLFANQMRDSVKRKMAPLHGHVEDVLKARWEKLTPEQKAKYGQAPISNIGYAWFAQEAKEDIKRDNPNISYDQINPIIKTRWEKLTPDERAKYIPKSVWLEAEFDDSAAIGDLAKVKELLPSIEKSRDPGQAYINAFREAVVNNREDIVNVLIDRVSPAFIKEMFTSVIEDGNASLFDSMYPLYVQDLMQPDPRTKRVNRDFALTQLGYIVSDITRRNHPEMLKTIFGSMLKKDIQYIIDEMKRDEAPQEEIDLILPYVR